MAADGKIILQWVIRGTTWVYGMNVSAVCVLRRRAEHPLKAYGVVHGLCESS